MTFGNGRWPNRHLWYMNMFTIRMYNLGKYWLFMDLSRW